MQQIVRGTVVALHHDVPNDRFVGGIALDSEPGRIREFSTAVLKINEGNFGPPLQQGIRVYCWLKQDGELGGVSTAPI